MSLEKYYVVYTVESTRATNFDVHVVPSHWIVGKVLHYPPAKAGKEKIESLLRAATLVSIDPKWKKYAFVLKKKFNSFDDATNFANKKGKSDDTDSEADNKMLAQLLKMQAAINEQKIKSKKREFPRYILD